MPKKNKTEQKSNSENTRHNRRTRRAFMKRSGMLKYKNSLRPFSKEWLEWYREKREEGKKLHQQHLEFVERQQYEQLQRMEDGIVKTLKENGYSKKEIDEYLESWYETVI